jgi:hypothetical protein
MSRERDGRGGEGGRESRGAYRPDGVSLLIRNLPLDVR